MRRRLGLAILLLALHAMPAAAQGTAAGVAPEALAAEQEARYRQMIQRLRCLVCQNQTIADSNAPLAEDLRQQVHQRIAAGESDEQIRRYLTDRYGDFVLYKPPFNARTVALWLGPFVLLLIALAGALIFMRRSGGSARVAPAADPEALRRLLEEETPRS